MSQYLLNTPSSYYFRIKVPVSLRSVIKKREIKISLRTEDKQRAVRLAMQHAIHYHDHFDRLRGLSMSDPLFTFIKNPSFTRSPDGTVNFTADYIDPDKAVEELMLINGIFSTMSQVHSFAPVQMLPPVTEPKPNDLLSFVIDSYCADKGINWDEKYRKGMLNSFRIAIDALGDKTDLPLYLAMF